jgi:hypothetical protein
MISSELSLVVDAHSGTRTSLELTANDRDRAWEVSGSGDCRERV